MSERHFFRSIKLVEQGLSVITRAAKSREEYQKWYTPIEPCILLNNWSLQGTRDVLLDQLYNHRLVFIVEGSDVFEFDCCAKQLLFACLLQYNDTNTETIKCIAERDVELSREVNADCITVFIDRLTEFVNAVTDQLCLHLFIVGVFALQWSFTSISFLSFAFTRNETFWLWRDPFKRLKSRKRILKRLRVPFGGHSLND